MNETSKSMKFWGPLERSVLSGRGIDIGCGPDPLNDHVRKFDMEDGDANKITDYVKDQFDFVFSSHCLEHMHNPKDALHEWWRLVKPSGHLFFIVPDEDLYEQGVFPSRFNGDHKATFTISKARSWSPVSHNVLDLANSLPDGRLVNMVLQDHGYDRRLMKYGPLPRHVVFRAYRSFVWRTKLQWEAVEKVMSKYFSCDQSRANGALSQIQCIVQKLP